MIIGTGIDIVQISQVNRLKNLERFLERFYAFEEIRYIRQKKIKKELLYKFRNLYMNYKV